MLFLHGGSGLKAKLVCHVCIFILTTLAFCCGNTTEHFDTKDACTRLEMPKAKEPEAFDFDRPESWPSWKRRFTRFRLATKLAAEDEATQVSSLIYHMGPAADDIYTQFQFAAAGDSDKWDPVIAKFDDYFRPHKNIVHNRAVFHKRTQHDGETIEQYYRELTRLAELCDFPDKNQAIRDIFVIGIRDAETSKKLQLIDNVSLDDAVRQARQAEDIDSHMKNRSNSSTLADTDMTDPRSLDVVHQANFRGQARGRGRGGGRGDRRGPRNFARGRAATYGFSSQVGASSTQESCGNCGYQHQEGSCPAYRQKCYGCGRYGHFRRLCRSRLSEISADTMGVEASNDVTDQPSQDYDRYFFGSIHSDSIDGKISQPWFVTLAINGSLLDFKVDTGADATVISEQTFSALRYKPMLFPTDRKLSTLSGDLDCLGWFSAKTRYNDEDYVFRVYVLRGSNLINLLSRDVSCRMQLVTPAPGIALDIVHMNQDGTDIYGDIHKPAVVKPVTLTLKENYEPYHVAAPRKVPIPLQDAVQQEIEWMLRNDVIRPVQEPTEWCAPITLPIKKNGKIRVCVDLRRLNQHLMRPAFPLPTIEDITSSLSGSRFFSKLDASRGYWQLPLSDSSQLLTTFMTSQGRFCFKRLPYGICVASDVFQSVMSQLLRGMPGVVCYQDDILVHAPTQAEHDERLQAVLDKLIQTNIKLNKDKCVYSQTQLEFLGHLITGNGCLPDPSKVKAITDLPVPTAENLRSVIGMLNYLGRYVPNFQSIMQPLYALLKNDVEFAWGHLQQTAFDRVKELITNAPVLSFFDPHLPSVLSCDASSYGIGCVLMQNHNGCLRPVAYASRMLSSTEQRYAQIEKECLSCVWACEKFSMYLLGLESFRLLTDHKPLVPLIASRDIDKVPARIQRLLLRLMPYRCVPEHIPGKSLVVADTLSRLPVSDAPDDVLALEVDACAQAVKSTWSVSSDKLNQIRLATSDDLVLSRVLGYVTDGWPKYEQDISQEVKPYFTHSAHLSVIDGVLTFDDRIVIPKSMQPEILQRLHAGHWGISKTRSFAADTVWWIGMSRDIIDCIKRCEFCQIHQSAQRHEPLLPSSVPRGPWKRVGIDLCYFDRRNYVVAMDYFSKYIEIMEVHSQTTALVITKLKSIFARWGIPDNIVTDNGPCFASKEFTEFARFLNLIHTTTSPHHSQSNGQAESGVKIAKMILRQSDPFLAMLTYRATPTNATGMSPAQLIMGRRIATHLPILEKRLEPQWPDNNQVRSYQQQHKESYANVFNEHHGVRPLPCLKPSDTVRLKTDKDKTWSTPGTIVGASSTPRSFVVKTPDGSLLRRNRRHIQVVPELAPVPSGNEKPALPSLPGPSTPYPDVPVPQNTPNPIIQAAPAPLPNTPSRPVRALKPRKRLIEEMDSIKLK